MPDAQWITDLGATAVDKLWEFSPLSGRARDALIGAGQNDPVDIVGVDAILVGQGDCNAIMGSDGHPLIYFDCGGGCGKAAETYPWHAENQAPGGRPDPASAFDVTHEPFVFLSHWDHDHFYSAERADNIRGMTFIAPRQKVSGQYVKFVEENLTMRCWPTDAPIWDFRLALSGYALVVERCTGAPSGNRNYSGLALTLARLKQGDDEDEEQFSDLVEEDDEDEPPPADDAPRLYPDDYDELIMMPGDAPYRFIPSLDVERFRTCGRFVGFFAYHHGSQTSWGASSAYIPQPLVPDEDEDAPPATTNRQCGYTYGLKRGGMSPYHVPAAKAVRELRQAGWTRRLNTSGVTGDEAVLNAQYEMAPNPFAQRGDVEIRFSDELDDG